MEERENTNREDFIKRAVPRVINDMGEERFTRENSIVFSNGWVASIVDNDGVMVYSYNEEPRKEYKSDKKFSVAVCDYNGYFDWNILNSHGAIDGCIYCDNEDEICAALSIIESLS